MPIKIPDSLPAAKTLEGENIFVMTEHRAMHQDIRPLKLLLLNLMPTKVATETQILRKLSNTPLQIEVELLHTASHSAKNTSSDHLSTFYRTFDQVENRQFDGMIITGAPVELLDFEQVDYWDELCHIMEWSRRNVHSTLHICWGAQAGIYYHYSISKHELPEKVSGVFEHYVVKPSSPLVRGFDDRFWAPHSRYTEVEAEDIAAHPDLELIATSPEVGAYLAKSTDSRCFFVFGHPEYDTDTLQLEYERDRKLEPSPNLPAHYFPNDNPRNAPANTWRAHAQLLYTNWLNYYVYQTTPYDLASLGEEKTYVRETAQAGGASMPRQATRSQQAPKSQQVPAPRQAPAFHKTAEAKSRQAPKSQQTPASRQSAEPRENVSRETFCSEFSNAITMEETSKGETSHDTQSIDKIDSTDSANPTASANHIAKPPENVSRETFRTYFRAENEDDDGYDPYSDRREEPPLFERDPWR